MPQPQQRQNGGAIENRDEAIEDDTEPTELPDSDKEVTCNRRRVLNMYMVTSRQGHTVQYISPRETMETRIQKGLVHTRRRSRLTPIADVVDLQVGFEKRPPRRGGESDTFSRFSIKIDRTNRVTR